MATEFQPPPTWADPMLEEKDLRTGETKVKFNPVWLKWFVDLTSLITVSGGGGGGSVGFNHNLLGSLQGGGTGEFYHFTLVQHQALALLAVPAPISATIVTAKLTAGGVNGSMTFVNGLLTASTPAT